MTSNSLQQITVPFHNAELFLVEHNGQPYTPMKPIVDGMGLDWKSQYVKLKQRFDKGMVEITIPTNGGLQTMICLLLRKLPAWLYSIMPGKVKPELRDTVIKYQEECDDVLWDYWTKGIAVNPRSTKEEREPLTNAVNLLVAKTKHLNYSDAYKLVHQRFNVKHIDEIPFDEIPVAVEYVHHLIALYSNAERKSYSVSDIHNLHALATHMILVREWWREFGGSIKKLNPAVYTTITDNFIDGSFLAWHFIKPDQKQALINHINTFNWLGSPYQQKLAI
ncbi:phage antirepressor N-terminal domain-containing protein [Acinetobacter bereziniae]|uniref:phage antirepressor N-terminal domain-containing protein n=1 Tax=Acinetobacter bereziniae TaxID=106648 RepID=UPI0009E43585|nr:phage antirepressor N-terminal domain-containing protein [Acinetobacter bereziniae]RSZ23648.1 phage antirepressor protein [Acinetobacter bereziniae]